MHKNDYRTNTRSKFLFYTHKTIFDFNFALKFVQEQHILKNGWRITEITSWNERWNCCYLANDQHNKMEQVYDYGIWRLPLQSADSCSSVVRKQEGEGQRTLQCCHIILNDNNRYLDFLCTYLLILFSTLLYKFYLNKKNNFSVFLINKL